MCNFIGAIPTAKQKCNNMKIGIITFWQSNDNYGQVLQCLALQQYLINLGHKPFLIKYAPTGNSPVKKGSIIKRFLKVLLVFPAIRTYKKYKEKKENLRLAEIIEVKNKKREFDKFRSEHIAATDKVYHSIEELRACPPEADCYITGSDQVWIMTLANEHNKGYFLDFGPKNVKRVSYAASFSRYDYPKELLPVLKEMLSHFDAISVREESGVEICKAIGIEAKHVVDPTLLMNMDFYKHIASSARIQDSKFAYLYLINIKNKDEIYWAKLSKYIAKKGIKPIVTTSSGHFPGRELITDVEYVYATIPEWLSYIDKSEFVATTSFHGLVLSLIHNKNFVYFPLKGHNSQGNTRITSLLSDLDLENKICRSANDVVKCIDSKVDWEKVNARLENLIENSRDFIDNAL